MTYCENIYPKQPQLHDFGKLNIFQGIANNSDLLIQ